MKKEFDIIKSTFSSTLIGSRQKYNLPYGKWNSPWNIDIVLHRLYTKYQINQILNK